MNPLPSGLLLFDSSVYIRYIRSGWYPWLFETENLVLRTMLTVVVAAELYAGARSREDKKELDIVWRRHQYLGMLSCPPPETWLLAGVLLERYARLYGGLRYADHFRDILIALEASRHRATLVTENATDFLRWRRLLKRSGVNLEVLRPPRYAGS